MSFSVVLAVYKADLELRDLPAVSHYRKKSGKANNSIKTYLGEHAGENCRLLGFEMPAVFNAYIIKLHCKYQIC